MNTEKYHSLAAYDIYLIVPGCESPLELRCRGVLEGQPCTGRGALAPLAPTSCGSELHTQPSVPWALSSALSLLDSLSTRLYLLFYGQRVKCLRNGITDLRPAPTRGWGRAEHCPKRQALEPPGDGHLHQGRPFP